MMLYTKYESSGPCSIRQGATNLNGLNNFDRGLHRDHSCEVWLKSNKRAVSEEMLFKEIVDGSTHGRTHGRTDDGCRTLKDHKSSLSTSCSGELKKTIKFVKLLPVNLLFNKIGRDKKTN